MNHSLIDLYDWDCNSYERKLNLWRFSNNSSMRIYELSAPDHWYVGLSCDCGDRTHLCTFTLFDDTWEDAQCVCPYILRSDDLCDCSELHHKHPQQEGLHTVWNAEQPDRAGVLYPQSISWTNRYILVDEGWKRGVPLHKRWACLVADWASRRCKRGYLWNVRFQLIESIVMTRDREVKSVMVTLVTWTYLHF